MTENPNPTVENGRLKPPNLNDYGLLLKRLIKVFDGIEEEAKAYLDTQLVRNRVDPQKLNWGWNEYSQVAIAINELERLKPKAKRTRTKKEEPMIDLLGNIEPTPPAEEPGIDTETGEVDLLGGVDEPEAPKPAASADEPTAAKDYSPSAESQSTSADASGGASSVQPVDEIREKIHNARELLGIPQQEPFAIETRKDVDRVMRRRQRIISELSYIIQQYNDIKPQLESALESWEFLYKEQLEAWRRMNPPATGKAVKTLWGALKLQDAPATVSFDEERDHDRSRFKAFLYTMPINLREELNVREVKDITCDRDKFDAWFKRRAEELKAPPPVPGIKYTPATKDKFFVSPSLDTIKDHIRKGTYQEKTNEQ